MSSKQGVIFPTQTESFRRCLPDSNLWDQLEPTSKLLSRAIRNSKLFGWSHEGSACAFSFLLFAWTNSIASSGGGVRSPERKCKWNEMPRVFCLQLLQMTLASPNNNLNFTWKVKRKKSFTDRAVVLYRRPYCVHVCHSRMATGKSLLIALNSWHSNLAMLRCAFHQRQ